MTDPIIPPRETEFHPADLNRDGQVGSEEILRISASVADNSGAFIPEVLEATFMDIIIGLGSHMAHTPDELQETCYQSVEKFQEDSREKMTLFCDGLPESIQARISRDLQRVELAHRVSALENLQNNYQEMLETGRYEDVLSLLDEAGVFNDVNWAFVYSEALLGLAERQVDFGQYDQADNTIRILKVGPLDSLERFDKDNDPRDIDEAAVQRFYRARDQLRLDVSYFQSDLQLMRSRKEIELARELVGQMANSESPESKTVLREGAVSKFEKAAEYLIQSFAHARYNDEAQAVFRYFTGSVHRLHAQSEEVNLTDLLRDVEFASQKVTVDSDKN